MVLAIHVLRRFCSRREPVGTWIGRGWPHKNQPRPKVAPVSPISGANLAHAGTVLPPIHLKRPWQGFCVLAAGISAPGGIFLAASTEKVPQAALRWIGGKQKYGKHIFLPLSPNTLVYSEITT